MHPSRPTHLLLALLALALLAGCRSAGTPQATDPTPAVRPTAQPVVTVAVQASPEQPAEAVPSPTAAAPALPTPAPVASSTASPAPKPTRGALGIQADPGVPAQATEQMLQLLQGAGLKAEVVDQDADLQLSGLPGQGATLAWERIFVPVDRMSSVLASITLQELRDVWTGGASSDNFATIYPDEMIVPDLATLLGTPGPAVKPQPRQALAAAVWDDRMGLGIVPFEDLAVRMRAIPIDGNSTVDNRFRSPSWPLAMRSYLAALTPRGKEALGRLAAVLPVTNRDPQKLTVLVMTGVTAMARNSAVAIERAGDYGFLARQVGPELAAADITVISNEIPFVQGCVADNTLNNLLLCSKPEYFENLALSGVDAVGLSGNHQNDFGYDAMRSSLAFYTEQKIPVYGGGSDDKEARKPLILEHNGHRLGFLGANQWGPEWYPNKLGQTVSAWAGPDYPGSARFDLAQMVADIQALRPQVDLVFAEVQHTEFNAAGDYQTGPIPQQVADFQAMSDGGADVVTGVMAHAPQIVELRDGRVILYGLGNLYFDQTWSWPTRTGLVARHTLYAGKLINTELLVTVIETNFQLRWATPEERMQVLRSVFDLSRW